MSKYDPLWRYIKDNKREDYKLTYEDIRSVLGFDIDHSFLKYKKELLEYGYEIVKISSPTSAKYPSDIALNALKIGNLICGKLKYVAKEIIEYAKALGFQLIDVKQGYSACSTLVLDDDTVVTADKSIYNALAKAGKRVVLISQGDIKLDGYDYGFIGGASCVIDDTVYFFGDIKKHKDYEKIYSEIARLKMKEKSISCEDVFDFGGARAIWRRF